MDESLRILHGFYISGSLIPCKYSKRLQLKQVVVSRRDTGVRKWVNWVREDLSSRPYVWLSVLILYFLLPFLVDQGSSY